MDRFQHEYFMPWSHLHVKACSVRATNNKFLEIEQDVEILWQLRGVHLVLFCENWFGLELIFILPGHLESKLLISKQPGDQRF